MPIKRTVTWLLPLLVLGFSSMAVANAKPEAGAPGNEQQAFDHEHRDWDALLKKHVRVLRGGQVTQVDYAAFKADPKPLRAYLARLSAFKESDFNASSKEEQIAFLINVYNAFMIDLVIQNHPVSSVKKIGIPFVGPWKKAYIPVFGRKLSLDDVEHGMLRKNYNEPRIHFGVNCASVSCPPLRAEAFVGRRLGAQLDEQAGLFFTNESENSFDSAKGVLSINPILKWFSEDFTKTGDPGLVSYVSQYLPALAAELRAGKAKADGIRVEFKSYNWALNGPG